MVIYGVFELQPPYGCLYELGGAFNRLAAPLEEFGAPAGLSKGGFRVAMDLDSHLSYSQYFW